MGNPKYGNVRKGPAPDLGDGKIYSSGWERDVARFLRVLTDRGILEGFDYEPMAFSFQSLGYKRGPFTYVPDFALRYSASISTNDLSLLRGIFDEIHPGHTVFLEVKGQETGKDRNKWRRFRKHTQYPLEIVKRDKLKRIQDLSFMVPNWESKVY